jgi:hypothetical protein
MPGTDGKAFGAAVHRAAAAPSADRVQPSQQQRQPPVPATRITLTGCSGKSINEHGIRRDVYGTWMGRSSWEDLAKGHWLMVEESGVPKWRREHFERALDKKPTCIGEFGNVARKGNKPGDSHGVGDCPEYIDAIYDWAKTCPSGCRYLCYCG